MKLAPVTNSQCCLISYAKGPYHVFLHGHLNGSCHGKAASVWWISLQHMEKALV